MKKKIVLHGIAEKLPKGATWGVCGDIVSDSETTTKRDLISCRRCLKELKEREDLLKAYKPSSP